MNHLHLLERSIKKEEEEESERLWHDLQAQPIAAELAAKLLGNRVAVSPIVTVEPRRRKFHKPITLTIPVPQAANKGMINQYSGDAPTLRLLCSITVRNSGIVPKLIIKSFNNTVSYFLLLTYIKY
ncbi:Ankyrin-2 [Blattella germanica]|nr:Ankyrin-2 [Blattella germanica]